MHLIAIIPMISRGLPGLRFADKCLKNTPLLSRLCLLYRKGCFNQGRKCLCGRLWQRGHEDCPSLQSPYQLTRSEMIGKAVMIKNLRREREDLKRKSK